MCKKQTDGVTIFIFWFTLPLQRKNEVEIFKLNYSEDNTSILELFMCFSLYFRFPMESSVFNVVQKMKMEKQYLVIRIV